MTTSRSRKSGVGIYMLLLLLPNGLFLVCSVRPMSHTHTHIGRESQRGEREHHGVRYYETGSTGPRFPIFRPAISCYISHRDHSRRWPRLDPHTPAAVAAVRKHRLQTWAIRKNIFRRLYITQFCVAKRDVAWGEPYCLV